MKISTKKIKQISIALLLASSLTSCDIEVIPQNSYVEESVWEDPATVELYINGMYAEFKNFQFGVFPGLGYDNATDALTDIMKFTSNTLGNGTVNTLASNANQFSPASVGLNYWSTGYNRIRRVNEFLKGLKTKSKLTADEQVRYEAEARFIRAYVYSWLARIHGSVVIFKDLDQYALKDNERASETEVYDFMIEDLSFAAANLPKTQPSGRANKGAANALLARVAVYAGSIATNDRKLYNTDPKTGIDQNLAKGYYEAALRATQEVDKLAAEGIYDLDPEFAHIFSDKNTKEAIFRVDFVAPAITHQYDLGYVPPSDAPGNALVYGVPTAELVDAFQMADGTPFSWSNPTHAAQPYENREDRFYATILYNGAAWKGRTIRTSIEDPVDGFAAFGSTGDPKRTVTGYYAKKLLDESNTTFVMNRSTQSWIELRYAETVLIAAEAKAQLGDFPGATAAINKLRAKRGLNNVNVTNLTTAMRAVEHERIVELAFEGHRFWDLRRWRKAHIQLNNVQFSGHRISSSGNTASFEVVSADAVNRSFTGKLYYLPIPEGEVQVNTGLTQIQGW
ncbi:RagB/SusD family nutrient uptake outer membrane protein [Sphingobacterium suaedae]|uniref:RagB/SusD family nutrient uptake outer membrane protein n=1 Tax=Sphingobacterium suaedae TaxID=1686402 RepID=A0ABW5KPD6_9SPHI